MKRTTVSRIGAFFDMRFLMQQAKNGTSRVAFHTVATALLESLFVCGEWLVLVCVLYLLETKTATNVMWSVLILLAAVMALLRFALSYEQSAFARSRDRFRTNAGIKLAAKALAADYATATDAAHQTALSRASQAIGRHIEAPVPHAWKTLSALLTYALTAVVYSAVLARYHVGLWCVTAITAFLGALVHRFVSDRGAQYRDEEAPHDARLAYVSQAAGSPFLSKDIRVFNLAPWLKAVFDSGFHALQALSCRRAGLYALFNVAEALLIVLSGGFAYLVLLDAVLHATLSLSAFCLYAAAVGGLTWAVRGLCEDAMTLENESMALAQYRCFMNTPVTTADEGESPTSGVTHTVELRDVTLTQRGASEPTLEHLSFTWHRGEKLAIVADSDSKAALAKLLCGLYDPDEGALLLDGKDVRTFSRSAYYALFSTVLQDTTCPDMTVSELVTQADGEADDKRLQDCLVQAGAAAFVAALPQGVNTPIGRTAFEDGVELSGGQMQRLLLARALYKDGDLLILDEPAAALDPLAEGALYRDYDRLTRGKGVVFLSHRLAATRFCDRVLVLKNGAVCEEGTHDELIKQGGEYARLFALQSRYYREGRNPS